MLLLREPGEVLDDEPRSTLDRVGSDLAVLVVPMRARRRVEAGERRGELVVQVEDGEVSTEALPADRVLVQRVAADRERDAGASRRVGVVLRRRAAVAGQVQPCQSSVVLGAGPAWVAEQL